MFVSTDPEHNHSVPIGDAIDSEPRVSPLVKESPWTETSRRLMGRKTKLACLGLPTNILDQGSPEYAKCVRLANKYKKVRTKELYLAHGYVSAGVNALLSSASLAIAASRFLYAAAAENGSANPGLIKIATSLSDSARQSELSAWELCSKEAIIFRKNSKDKSMPWLVEPKEVVEKRVFGHKRGPNKNSAERNSYKHRGTKPNTPAEDIKETEELLKTPPVTSIGSFDLDTDMVRTIHFPKHLDDTYRSQLEARKGNKENA